MEISFKQFALIVALFCFATASVTYAAVQYPFDFDFNRSPEPQANVFVFHNGLLIYEGTNDITDIGEEHVRDYMSGGGSMVASKYIAIGNVSGTLTAKTQLDSEYNRQTGTVANWTNAGDYAYNSTYTWTFTETQRLDGAGLHWAASGNNNLFACDNFDATTFNTDDNLTITWSVTFNAN